MKKPPKIFPGTANHDASETIYGLDVVRLEDRDRFTNVQQGSVFSTREIDDETIKHYVEKRSSVHETQIKETERTKRTTLVVSAVIYIAAAILVVFSPQDKEVLAYGIAGSMLLLASGIAGYGILRVKTDRFSAEASQGSHK